VSNTVKAHGDTKQRNKHHYASSATTFHRRELNSGSHLLAERRQSYTQFRLQKIALHILPSFTLDDQFGVSPTDGSTTCALICLLYHVTRMLERCSYVRCIMIDFSKALDRVNRPILFGKLTDGMAGLIERTAPKRKKIKKK